VWLVVVVLHCWLFTSNTVISVAVCHRDSRVMLSRLSGECQVAIRVLTSALVQKLIFQSSLPKPGLLVSEAGPAALLAVLRRSPFAGCCSLHQCKYIEEVEQKENNAFLSWILLLLFMIGQGYTAVVFFRAQYFAIGV